MSTSKETPLANMSRKRMKETRPRAKRTASQLAHLEELVEEKKPGSLNGSFSVFEVAAPEPRKREVTRAVKVKHALTESSTIPGPASASSMKRQDSNITPEFVLPRRPSIAIPNISRINIQSLARIQPHTDLRNNTISGVLNDTPAHNAYLQAKSKQSSSDVSSLSNNYMTSGLQHHFPPREVAQASLPTRSRIASRSPLADSYSSNTTSSDLNPIDTPKDASHSSTSSHTHHSLGVDDYWSWSSRFMLEGPKGAELARLEDCLSEDTLVRAIMFGWDSIGESCELSPFWRIIRQLDENFFRLFGPIERMASFKIMHTLLKFHSDPTVQRAATLPNFYQSRGIDFEGDYYIGNFLPWPGIRNMTKSPLHPCRSNKWFQTQLRTLTLLWPYRLEDSFTRSTETGLFKLTDDFNRRTYDLNCWTFGSDMYEEFPVIFGAAPSRGTLPGAVGHVGRRGAAVEGRNVMRRRIEYLDTAEEEEEWDDGGRGTVKRRNMSEDVLRNDIMRMMEASPVNYNNLNWREEQQDGKNVVYFTLW